MWSAEMEKKYMRKLCGKMRENTEIVGKICGHSLRQNNFEKNRPEGFKKIKTTRTYSVV